MQIIANEGSAELGRPYRHRHPVPAQRRDHPGRVSDHHKISLPARLGFKCYLADAEKFLTNRFKPSKTFSQNRIGREHLGEQTFAT